MADLRPRAAETVGVPTDHARYPTAVVGPPLLRSTTGHPGTRLGTAQFRTFPSERSLQAVPDEARRSVIAAAEEILAGQWELLGTLRQDMEDPDWFFDPVTGTRAPQVDYCFKVNHRSEDVTGNVKQIWELSRMHHLTVLAAAFASPATNAMPNAPPLISVPGGHRTPSSRACTGRAESRPGSD